MGPVEAGGGPHQAIPPAPQATAKLTFRTPLRSNPCIFNKPSIFYNFSNRDPPIRTKQLTTLGLLFYSGVKGELFLWPFRAGFEFSVAGFTDNRSVEGPT